MAREKHWSAFGPILLISDGGIEGEVEISDTCGLFVKQEIILKSSAVQIVSLEIKRVISKTQLKVGPKGKNIDTFTDITTLLVADGAAISGMEQARSIVPPTIIEQSTYAGDPIVAVRTHAVDCYGDPYKVDNPLPVQLSDGSINIGVVEANIEVHTTHLDDSPEPGRIHDSMRIGDGTAIAKVDPQNKSFSVNRYEKILPLLTNAKWLELVDYEEVTTNFAGDVATLSYLKGGNIVANAIFTFVDDFNWGFKLESYINDDGGDQLLDDDDTPLFID